MFYSFCIRLLLINIIFAQAAEEKVLRRIMINLEQLSIMNLMVRSYHLAMFLSLLISF